MWTRSKGLLALATATLAVAAPAGAAAPTPTRGVALQGERVVVRADGHTRRIALTGVALPDGASCWAERARTRLRTLVVGARVRVERDGRSKTYLVAGGRDVGLRLIAGGDARVAPGRFARRAAYLAAQRRARLAGRGLWGCAAASSPSSGPELPGATAPGGAAPEPPGADGGSPPSVGSGSGGEPGPGGPGGPGSDPGGTPGTSADRYDIGAPALRDLWVDPVGGDNANDGAARDRAVRTIAEAWRRTPAATDPGQGIRILLVPGVYPQDEMPNYWEGRHGTRGAPIVLQSADGAGTVRMGNVNLYDLRYVYFLGLTLDSPNDVFHCERCDHVLLRDSVLRGGPGAQETVKINQSQHVFLEGDDISGAWDNAIDFVAVQYAHVLDSEVHNAADWCAYAKGGSAYVRYARNEIHDCGTGGFTAGQGTGFQFMTPPWIHYEAYDVKVYDNVVHDTEGAGLGVNGGFDVLLAHNTLYRVGSRSHALEVVFGGRSCDGPAGAPDRQACRDFNALGGWGDDRTDDGNGFVRIPNRHVYVYDNVIDNPAGFQTRWSHLSVAGPFAEDSQRTGGAPFPALADDDLRFAGNVIANGPPDHSSGFGDTTGCRDTNPTCNEARLHADNWVNTVTPDLRDPEHGDYRPVPGGTLASLPAVAPPAFAWDDAPSTPAVPPGDPDNGVAPPGTPPGAWSAAG